MSKNNRRDFIKLAGIGSMAVFLAGTSGLSCQNPKRDKITRIEDQIDPWIELDMDNLASNVQEVRRKIGQRPIMAMVKCNAYGHGMVEVSTALQSNSHIRHFGVVKVREALLLRENGVKGMILNVGPFNRMEVRDLIENDISQSVYTDAVHLLAKEARRQGKIAKVQICLDTGLARVGVPYKKAFSFIEKVADIPELKIEGIFTSLTEDEDYNPVQINRIKVIGETARKKGIDVGLLHAASSADIDQFPYTYLDMVRPGNCLVGLEHERQTNMNIKPVMSFKTRVIYVKRMSAGETLSYKRAYKLTRDSVIATLPCGHSDGYPAVVANKADVLIQGRRFPLVGPITCNHMMVDVTGFDDVDVGDEVVLWGPQGNEEITKLELENLDPHGTNAYRMATRTRTYLPRFKMGD